MIIEIGRKYRNKKNQQLYKVERIVRHSETLEIMVQYKALYDVPVDKKFWVRPMDLFIEKFEEVLT